MSKSPIKTFKSGPVTASVWENQGKYGHFRSFTLDCHYQKDGKWCYTKTLSDDSLPHAIKALKMADKYNDQWRQESADDRNRERTTNDNDQPSYETNPTDVDSVDNSTQASNVPEPEVIDSGDLDSYL